MKFYPNYVKVLNAMPKKFTSNAFIYEAKKYEYSNDTALRFLKTNCKRINRKTWYKSEISEPVYNDSKYFQNELIPNEQQIQSIIQYLKSKGWKILKPKTEYEEI